MTLSEIDTWSVENKVKFLARLAHELTVCARGTYEVGTTRVLEPEILRSYNEFQHRVTGSLVEHLLGTGGIPLSTVLRMMKDFGVKHDREQLIEGAIQAVEQHMTGSQSGPRTLQ